MEGGKPRRLIFLAVKTFRRYLYNKKPFKDRKAYLNITAALSIYIPIIRTKGVRPYIVSLIISFQSPFIKLSVF